MQKLSTFSVYFVNEVIKNNGVLCVAMLHEQRSICVSLFFSPEKENNSASRISSTRNVISESAVLHHVDVKY